MLTNPAEGEVFAPVALFLEAIDLVLQRLKEQGADFSKVQGISGAGMQHGTVFWSQDAEHLLANLDAGKTLLEQLEGRGFATDANTLYPLLRRLEKQEYLTSEWNTDEARPRKFYRTSEAVIRLADTLTDEWRALSSAIASLTAEEN